MKRIHRQLVNNRVRHWIKKSIPHTTRGERIFFAVLVISLLTSGILSLVGVVDRWTTLIPQGGGIYEEAAVGGPHVLNPLLAAGNDVDNDIMQLVYSSLFTLDKNLKLTPDLAEHLEVSTDKKHYTVKLRAGVTWHDDHPLTADDVIFTIASAQAPTYNSPLAKQFQGVTVEKIDDLTVRFNLPQPYAPFPINLITKIIPRHVWENIPPQNAALAEQNLKPVGSGPFRFTESTTRRKTGEITALRLTRNLKYYGQPPYLDEVKFLFYPTHEEALAALRSRQVDGVSFVPLQLLNQITNRSSLSPNRLLLPQYFALFFNQEKNELLRDAAIRNALALAVDRNALVADALKGEGIPLHLPIPHGLLSQREDLKSIYDPETAKQNLEEAKWHDVDGDGIRERDNVRLRFKITTTDWPEYVRTAEMIQEQWRAIGVETVIEHFGAGTIQQTVVGPRDYEMLLFGEILPPDPDPYPFWHSTQAKNPGLNLALFRDKAVDKLLEEARVTSDEQERIAKYHEFQGKILDVTPAIILYQPYYLFATSHRVHGIDIAQAALPAQRFNNISNWHVRTQRIWAE